MILSHLEENPKRRYQVYELAKLFKLTPTEVRKELENAGDLVSVITICNKKNYFYRQEAPAVKKSVSPLERKEYKLPTSMLEASKRCKELYEESHHFVPVSSNVKEVS